MSGTQCSEVVGTWKGFQVASVRRIRPHRKHAHLKVLLELVPEEGQVGRCSGCGRRVAAVHEVCVRPVRDLPILEADTHLRVHLRRLACPRCGPRLETGELAGALCARDAPTRRVGGPPVRAVAREAGEPPTTGSAGMR